jgi:hypothetical protein
MPSFDVVSEVDKHELDNALDQTNRELGTRFDFKGSNASVEKQEKQLLLTAQSEFQIRQIQEILLGKLVKRGIDLDCLEYGKSEQVGTRTKQLITIREGVDKELAKKIVKLVKDSKIKVQAAVQGEQVRITGKKRDDLQQVITLLKQAGLGIPLQFTNFRD